jgi:hypothetical protein
MSEAGVATTRSVCVLLAVPFGRNGWGRKEAMLHYEAGRLMKTEGIDFTQTGPLGVTGTLYVVKESLCRDNRRVVRIERQKVVNGLIVDRRNWGEIEDTMLPQAA